MDRTWKILLILCAAYGPALLLMHYATWTVGRLVLGHWPRPSLDDPAGIPGLWVPYFVTLLFTMGLPVAAVLPIARAGVAALNREPGAARWVPVALVSTILLVASVLLLRWDPNQVATWFAD
ncbi:MAG: hypothetical protein ACKV19_27880 [Verrucomicrobiales bacterium]